MIALNPAALVVNLPHLAPHSLVVVDESAFTDQRLKRADLDSNPLDDGSLEGYQVIRIDMHQQCEAAVEGLGCSDDAARY